MKHYTEIAKRLMEGETLSRKDIGTKENAACAIRIIDARISEYKKVIKQLKAF